MTGPSFRIGWLLLVQAALIVMLFATLALTPPARGPMLIVSLTGQRSAAIAAWATHNEALLINVGPWRNSLLVSGTRRELTIAAFRRGALVVSARSAGCTVWA
jgi:hypothetical protein